MDNAFQVARHALALEAHNAKAVLMVTDSLLTSATWHAQMATL
ncbi:hypothetical protein MIDIC_260001 [Alphaproteobacteria bacterium]